MSEQRDLQKRRPAGRAVLCVAGGAGAPPGNDTTRGRHAAARPRSGKRLRGGDVCGKTGAGGGAVFGLEYDFERAREAARRSPGIVNAAGEALPYPDLSST